MAHKLFILTILLFAFSVVKATQLDILGPPGSGSFGKYVVALPNGNIVVCDPDYTAPGPIADVGAVYLYNGGTGALISTLTGNTANDHIGLNNSNDFSSSIVVLANGNFVVVSPAWTNGAAQAAGAVTWCSGSAGCSGTVSPANSLVGSTASDLIGADDNNKRAVIPLKNGNYVVSSRYWHKGALANVGGV